MQRGLVVLPRFVSAPAPSFTRFCTRKMSSSPSPVCPKFVSLEGGDVSSGSQPDGFRFRLVSYNVLAQVYVKSSLFPHSPKPCLRWNARSQAILSVLESLKAEFLCLQEVDEYDKFFRANMERNGYTGIYIQRSGQKRDGCSIFYMQDRAELVLEERIEYNDLVNTVQEGMASSDDSKDEPSKGKDAGTKPGSPTKSSNGNRGDPNDPRVRLKRDCVGIMAAFKLKDSSGRLIIIANTHLYWDPKWADVKLAQAKYLLSRLAQFRTIVSDKFDFIPPVILAGDFNSIPGDKVYQYLASGNPSSSFPPECVDELPIALRSVYGSTRGEPTFTNCTPTFTNTLDYIFFSPMSDLKPIGLLELPESDAPDIVGGLPNNYHPSDHLPIGAEFEIVP